MKIFEDSLRQGWGDLWMLPFRAKRIRCLMPSRITDQVCLGKNGFFWYPWIVWKLLEARLGLWAFRTCTGCKS